jgi:hypothetical protein
LGRIKFSHYSEEARAVQVQHYQSLSEREQRYFLGFEYKRLGVGSQRYLSSIFGCSRHRIRKGFLEIGAGSHLVDRERQRTKGGGRKKKR